MSLIRREFNTNATTMYSKKLNKWKNNEVPKEMVANPDIWKGFVDYWKEEETDSLSKKNLRNRRSNRGGEKNGDTQCGSNEFLSWEYQLVSFSFS